MGQDRLLANTVVEVDQSEFLSNLPLYTSGLMAEDKLAIARELFNANSYFPYIFGYPFGNTTELTFAARQTREGSLQVPPGSYLWGLTGRSFDSAGLADSQNMFGVSIVDKGSGMGITEREFTFGRNYLGYGTSSAPVTNGPYGTAGFPQGPFLLGEPWIITRPGQVGVKLTNLVDSVRIIQIALHFAVPLNDRSLNTPQIRQV